MNDFVNWSNAQTGQPAGQTQGGQPHTQGQRGPAQGGEDFDALEGRIRAAKEANKAYKQELNGISKNSPMRSNNKTELAKSFNSGAVENHFSKENQGGQSQIEDLHNDKFIGEFRILTRDMTDFLEKNKLKTLQHATGDPLSATSDAKRKEENLRRKEIKDKINSLLQQYDKSNDRIPMWRHRMRGNFMPRPEQVLKGKALFRGIALAVYVFYAKPMVQVLVKKREKRSAEEENFSKTLLLFRDACNSWMAKLNRLPIQSIQQDMTLDFNPHQHDKAESFRKRMIQLKVRVKAVVTNIVQAGLPPPHVAKFLGVLIEDGHYFKKDFFFDSEKRKLDFNSLGATRAMLQPLPEGSNDHTPENVMTIKGKLYNIERPRLLIRNFLLIKILIGQQLLSPWSVGLCSRPRHNKKQTLANFRIVATLIYDIVLSLDNDLPLVTHLKESISTRGMSSLAGEDGPGSWLSSLTSWLMRSGIDDEDAGLEQMLLDDHPIFETMREIQRFLYLKHSFTGVQSQLDHWMTPLAVGLGEWVETVVRHVIEMKYDPPAVAASPRGDESLAPVERSSITGPDAV
jgi:hypothetical protein